MSRKIFNFEIVFGFTETDRQLTQTLQSDSFVIVRIQTLCLLRLVPIFGSQHFKVSIFLQIQNPATDECIQYIIIPLNILNIKTNFLLISSCKWLPC